MNGLTASEKLGISSEVRELKFGDSFNGKGGSFHTIRYDFKPASVDTTKMATLDVNNSQVTISMQNTDLTSTVFAGPRKPYGKECVLIIDPETGECVLEKLTHSIQVKKTRQEGASRMSKHLPPAPPAPPEIKKHHIVTGGISSSQKYDHRIADSKSSNYDKKPSKTSLPSTSSSTNSLSINNPTQRRPHSPMLSVPNRHSPLSVSPGRLSPPNNGSNNVNSGNNAFDALLSNHSKQNKQQQQLHHQQQHPSTASLMPSLTNFDDLLAGTGSSSIGSGNSPAALSTSSSASFRGNQNNSSSVSKNSPHRSVVIPPPLPTTTGVISAATTALSESSSGDSSSSSSSEDDSSDEDMEVVPETEISMPSMPMFPTSSNFSSSPSLSVGASKTTVVPPINRSMPSHLLSEDLDLSESGSESD